MKIKIKQGFKLPFSIEFRWRNHSNRRKHGNWEMTVWNAMKDGYMNVTIENGLNLPCCYWNLLAEALQSAWAVVKVVELEEAGCGDIWRCWRWRCWRWGGGRTGRSRRIIRLRRGRRRRSRRSERSRRSNRSTRITRNIRSETITSRSRSSRRRSRRSWQSMEAWQSS